MYTIVVINGNSERHWRHEVTSKVSWRGAKMRASRWLNKNGYKGESIEEKKYDDYQVYWILTV